MQTPIMILLLAGGAGKRMRTSMQKVMHPLCGRPMLDWVRQSTALAKDSVPTVIVGHQKEQVMEHFGDRLQYIAQTQPRGSGSALLDAREALRGQQGRVLVVAGDLPLLTKDTILHLAHATSDAACLSARIADPRGYGRIIRDVSGNVLALKEEETLTEQERMTTEVRVSAYSFLVQALLPALELNAQRIGRGECAIGDIVADMMQQGASVEAISISPEEAMGVNDRVQLAACERILRRRINEQHMRNGVTMLDPDCTYIDATVKIGRDCILYPGIVLEGNTLVGDNTTLFPACHIIDSHIGSRCQARGVIARNAVVADDVTLGPFVHLRPNARLDARVKVGNFVEIKNANVGEGSKLPHLSYIGDGEIGRNSNLGCGTVFANYDGYKKHRTKVGDDVFIGCHTCLVAPVSVGNSAFTAAGSVITEDVPEDTLAIGRAKQVNKMGYIGKLRRKRGDGQ